MPDTKPETMPVKVLVLITSWNHLHYTLQCLETLRDCTPDTGRYHFDFVVVDDCSTEPGVVEGLSVIEGVRLIANETNRGITYCWNLGFREYKDTHDIIIFSNNDVKFSPGWAVNLCDCLLDNDLDMVGPVTNTPGFVRRQDIRNYLRGYLSGDDQEGINRTAALMADRSWKRAKRINGFCMCMRMEFLRKNVLPGGDVFDPANVIFKSDREIQVRTRPRTGVCLSSFIFHYKQISVGHLDGHPNAKVYRPGRHGYLEVWRHRLSSHIRTLVWLAALLAIAYVLAAPLPVAPLRNHRPEEKKAVKQRLLGDMESVEIHDGSLTGQEDGRDAWELGARRMQATEKRVVMDKARAVLFRSQLPDLILTAPSIVYLPLEEVWTAEDGVKGQAGPDLRLRMGSLNYAGKSKTVSGEKGVVLSGRRWKIKGGRFDADARFERIVVKEKVRLEYTY